MNIEMIHFLILVHVAISYMVIYYTYNVYHVKYAYLYCMYEYNNTDEEDNIGQVPGQC